MSRSFSFGNHLPILLSSEFDERESSKFADKIISCFEAIVGGRNAITFSPEIRLLATFIYFFIPLAKDSATPGQEYCGLAVVEPLSDRTNPHEIGNSLRFAQNIVEWARTFVQPVQQKRYQCIDDHRRSFLAAALLAIVPYLRSRRMNIFRTVAHLWTVITSDDDDATSISGSNAASLSGLHRRRVTPSGSNDDDNDLLRHTGSGISTNNTGIDRRAETASAGYSDDEGRRRRNSAESTSTLFLRLRDAVTRTWQMTGSTSSERVHGLLNWMQDLHLLLFFISGRYVSLRSMECFFPCCFLVLSTEFIR